MLLPFCIFIKVTAKSYDDQNFICADEIGPVLEFFVPKFTENSFKKDIIFNLNDGSALGWSKEIKKIIKTYKNRFLLKLINWGDADMINLYNHHNEFILPLANEKKPCGETYNYYLKSRKDDIVQIPPIPQSYHLNNICMVKS